MPKKPKRKLPDIPVNGPAMDPRTDADYPTSNVEFTLSFNPLPARVKPKPAPKRKLPKG